MGIAYNTSIVSNGLVLALDPANSRCYSGSGLTAFGLQRLRRIARLAAGTRTKNKYLNQMHCRVLPPLQKNRQLNIYSSTEGSELI